MIHFELVPSMAFIQLWKRNSLFVVFALVLASVNVSLAESPPPLKRIQVNGVELHYIDAGKGVPVIFVHGGLVDYRRWLPQIEPFSERYRVIVYSRRYNFPNTNGAVNIDHSALVEAKDLAELIRQLKLQPSHIIGESYGAYTALLLALQHPELVRTLILAETPLLDWLKEMPEGEKLYNQFMNELWIPLGDTFKSKDDVASIALIWKYFAGEGVAIPDPVRTLFEQNLMEWKKLNASSDAFPDVTEAAVRNMTKPVLMMTGENTLEWFKVLEPRVESVLPNVKRIIIPKATHEMWDEYPAECGKIALEFLSGQ